MLLAVNFHYIQPEGRFPYPGIYPTTTERFSSQLDALGRDFEIIGGNDLAKAVVDGMSLPRSACMITFDDGLKEQLLEAAPILEQKGMRGVFFICTQPLKEGRALTVHKMHWLRATRPPDAFLDQVLEVADAIALALDLDQVDDEAANQQYLYDDMATKRIKFLLNHLIPFEDFERLIDEMFSREMDEALFCRQLYMTEEDIQELSGRHSVGSHSHLHCPLAALSVDVLRDSLVQSRRILEDVTSQAVNLISYPYGGPTAVSWDVAEAARDAGFVAGFTMERSVNQTLFQPHLLARVSTNDAPGGKSPLLTVHNDENEFTFQAPLTGYRSVYVDERAWLEESADTTKG
jgi:peptidoglycan/xylan/chitin deacetylase (PgdA/CDA1 family)